MRLFERTLTNFFEKIIAFMLCSESEEHNNCSIYRNILEK